MTKISYWQWYAQEVKSWVKDRKDEWKDNHGIYNFLIYLFGGLISIGVISLGLASVTNNHWFMLLLLWYLPWAFGLSYFLYKWDQE